MIDHKFKSSTESVFEDPHVNEPKEIPFPIVMAIFVVLVLIIGEWIDAVNHRDKDD